MLGDAAPIYAKSSQWRDFPLACQDSFQARVVAQAKIARLATGGPGTRPGSGGAKDWEVENMRERLYCQVCNSRRQKDRVIKCGHAFCSHCIDAMGKSRQRLCPGCQSKFDHRADVRPLYL